MEFEDKVFSWIDSNALFEGVGRALLAVSGGADSVAMAHVLAGLKQGGQLLCDFMIGHVNHCLRGAESDADEAFVLELADSLGVPVVTAAVDVAAYAKEHKLSIETAGRVLRLKSLAQMAQENDCDVIATAHHKDDLAETMIHRFMRGTGFRGLCGILPVSNVYGARFIRPILELRREEIIQYCRDNSIQWREDASNASLSFTRNRIRHSLMPALESDAKTIVKRLSDLSKTAQRFLVQTEKQAQDVLDEAISDNQPGWVALQKSRLKSCPPWVFYELIRKVLVGLDVGLRDYTQEHFKMIHALVDQKQATITMPGPIQVYAQKGVLRFCRESKSLVLPSETVRLEAGQTVQFGPWKISSKLLKRDEADIDRFYQTKDAFVEWFDADRIIGDIEVRGRKDGDRFYPIGAKGEKKVARFLIDAQLGEKIKNQAFITADAEKILWVGPIRMSERVKITSKSRRILEIRVLAPES